MLPDYMAKQPDISGDMRAILVDWMVEVQVRGHGEGGMAFCRAAPHSAFGVWDLSTPVEAPVSVPSAELNFPLPRLGMSLHPSLQTWTHGHLWPL